MSDHVLSPADAGAPFTDLLGMTYTELTPTRVVAVLPVTDKLKQPYGIVHGGVYCTMAESAASVGGVIALEGAQGAVGQSNQTDFLRATREGTLTATATPVHVGRSVQLWAVDITDDEGRLCAQSRVRLFNLPVEAVATG